jgi:hypothetical protein
MNYRRRFLFIVIISFLLAAPLLATAQQTSGSQKSTTVVTMNAPSAPALTMADLLPERLAGAKATGEVKAYPLESLVELVADKAVIYQEYHTRAVAARPYNDTLRVEVFQMEDPHAAFGLFTYSAKGSGEKTDIKTIGSNSAVGSDGLIFWKNNYFIRIKSANPINKTGALHQAMAAALAEKIATDQEASEPPALFDSLPKNFLVAQSQRYFLGPESLNAYIERARDMFSFDGEAEAAVSEYRKVSEAQQSPNAANGATKAAAAKPDHSANQSAQAAKNVKLVIVEYHTPQFATDAMNRLNGYVATLSEEERDRFLVKRVGNFIVEATNFEDREFAESLVNSIEYPYVVKWLQNPAIPTNDPFRIQKAGQMLVSTFNLIGLTGGVVLLCGSILGTTIFFRRRKQQREVFSDAGGMIGLHLDPIEDALLGLPPANLREGE